MSDSRLQFADFPPIVDYFYPWWVRCEVCARLALMTPQWDKKIGATTCGNCGAVRSFSFGTWYVPTLYEKLPLWLRTEFRTNILWALNGEHLDFLESVLASKLRGQPVINGHRCMFSGRMPYNLPKWMISAKNRDDLLRIIGQLRLSIPAEMARQRSAESSGG